MNGRYGYRMGSFMVCATAALLAGCATAPTISNSKTAHLYGVAKVLVLPPVVECVNEDTDDPCTLKSGMGKRIQATILEIFQKDLTRRHVAVADLEAFPALADISNKDAKRLYAITKQNGQEVAKDDNELLLKLVAQTAVSHLLSSRCRIYVGHGGYWDPLSGAIGSNTSRVVIEEHIFSVKKRRRVWSRISQSRASQADSENAAGDMAASLMSVLKIN